MDNKILLYGLAGGFVAVLVVCGTWLAVLFAVAYVGFVWVKPLMTKNEKKADEEVKKEEVKKNC